MTNTLRARSASVAGVALAALVPKCPLCVAAFLSALGVGTAAAQWLAPWLRPAALVMLSAGLLALGRAHYRRFAERRRAWARTRPCCAS